MASVRTIRNLRERPTVYRWADDYRSAGELLRTVPGNLRSARVILCGPRPNHDANGFRAWMVTDEAEGWSPAGHYLANLAVPVLRYRHESGRAVEMIRAATWLGPTAGDTVPAIVMERTMAETAGELARVFPGAILMATPATTGRELFARSIPAGASWPVLPDELQQLVRATSGQGRIEALAARGELPGLYAYDGRLMYAALTRGLPGGPWRHGTGPAPVGTCKPGGCTYCAGGGVACAFRQGRYLVEWRAPAGWDRLGLLPAHDGDSWAWPPAGRGWVDGSELLLAQRAGWAVTVHEWLVWDGYRGAGPLDRWTADLLRVHDRASELGRTIVRAIILHGLGAFHGRGHLLTRETPWADAASVPAHAVALQPADDALVWHEDSGPAWPAMSHPEWTAAVWARCRARMAKTALALDHGQVAGIDTDCLHLTAPAPALQDTGKPGAFRLKRRRPTPMAYAGGGMTELRSLYDEPEPAPTDDERAAALSAIASIRRRHFTDKGIRDER